jgi:hypothetical protein
MGGSIRDGASRVRADVLSGNRVEEPTEGPLLLLAEGWNTISAALIREASRKGELLGALRVPRGGSIEAISQTLMTAASCSGAIEQMTGGAGEIATAAGRLAEQLGLPIRVVEIEGDAGRMVLAAPDRSTTSFEVAAAALVPTDPGERRRRADAVLVLLGSSDRSAVTDALGDLADAPLRDRDDERERMRVAATADALRRLGEALRGEEMGDVEGEGAPLLLLGSAASLIATGAMPLAAVAPLLALGRTRILLEPYGIFAALGDRAVDDDRASAVLGSLMHELLIPGGDMFTFDGGDADLATVQSMGGTHSMPRDTAFQLTLRSDESTELEISVGGLEARVVMHGGFSRSAVVFGDAHIDLSTHRQPALSTATAAAATVAPIPAPIQLLPAGGERSGLHSARLLLGDAVQGRVHFSEAEPDTDGWEAARAAGILAIVQASPETVLRARAVGVRGVLVCGLSDGERDALAASLERRIAAAVATEPFGLLVMTPRRMSERGRASATELLRGLHGGRIELSVEPVGMFILDGASQGDANRARGGDVLVIGGAFEGSIGLWEGLADARADDPLGAVRIGGTLRAIPLGDLQRVTA